MPIENRIQRRNE